ncbi:peptidoglycan bridge formation glycyltransferase FemA/FemB family protein [Candidatus Saccharibacteria bacterium]|nr:MAG: peptidoglycan bridge formation glycyltransferase FemA/FemB family protein [Candidatus Saccharibacteria bacterium]
MIVATPCESRVDWDEFVSVTNGHPLQLWGWGDVKTAHHWTAHRILVNDGSEVIGGAQLLVRKLPGAFRRFVYIPRGPVSRTGREVDTLNALASYVRHHLPGTVLSVEPNTRVFPDIKGWRHSNRTILIPNTLVLDLTRTESELQADMTKKTRQYIRKSQRAELDFRQITTDEELNECLHIYHETAGRAEFALHSDAYYRDVHRNLGDASVIMAAFYEDKPVAFLWLAVSQEVAFELYGGMNEEGQRRRANYALKWQTILLCKQRGAKQYDMNGLLNDGVSTFKKGFASQETMLAGTYDYPLSPLYTIWNRALPIAKKLVRTTGKVLRRP